MDWFTTKIADTATLSVFMGTLGVQVESARTTGSLDGTAEAYAVTEMGGVRLYVNSTARACLPALGALALLPSAPPWPQDRKTSLIPRTETMLDD